jgi:hypothetical protein
MEEYLVFLTFQKGETVYIRSQISMSDFTNVQCPVGYTVNTEVNLHVLCKTLNLLKDKKGGKMTLYDMYNNDDAALVFVARYDTEVITRIVVSEVVEKITEMSVPEDLFTDGHCIKVNTNEFLDCVKKIVNSGADYFCISTAPGSGNLVLKAEASDKQSNITIYHKLDSQLTAVMMRVNKDLLVPISVSNIKKISGVSKLNPDKKMILGLQNGRPLFLQFDIENKCKLSMFFATKVA